MSSIPRIYWNRLVPGPCGLHVNYPQLDPLPEGIMNQKIQVWALFLRRHTPLIIESRGKGAVFKPVV